MVLRVAHIINTFFLINLLLIILNVIMFLFLWKGMSITVVVMAIFCGLGLYLTLINSRVANISFQLWTFFSFFFILISYPATLYYQEIAPSIDVNFMVRSYVYNFIITFTCYQYVLFIIERDKIDWFLNFLNAFLIISTLITIFSIPLGLFTLQYAVQPRFLSLSRMSGIYFDPNFASFAANVTVIVSLSSLFRTKSPKLLGVLGIIIGFIGVLVTLSKTGILSLIILVLTTIIIYFTMYRAIEMRVRRVANIFFCFLLYGIFQFIFFLASNIESLPKAQRDRFLQIENLISGKGDKSDLSNRADLVQLGFQKIAEQPIFGRGYLSFTYLLDAGRETGDDVGVHNTFLRVWGEAGIFPFMLFMGFWGYVLWRGAQLPRIAERLLIISLASAFIIFALTIHTFLEDNFIGAFMGIMIAFLSHKKMDKIIV